MSTFNILWGQDERNDEKRMFEILVSNFRQFDLFNVGTLQVAHDKETLDREIGSGKYDVVVCSETIQGTQIGVGSVRTWEELKPGLKTILILDDDKKGKSKVFSLFTRHNYNCIFRRDFGTGELIAQMIATGRSEAQAVEYYGLKNNVDYLASLETQKPEQVPAKEDFPVEAYEAEEGVTSEEYMQEDIPQSETYRDESTSSMPPLFDEVDQLLGESLSNGAREVISSPEEEEVVPMAPYMAEDMTDPVFAGNSQDRDANFPHEPLFTSNYPAKIPAGLTKRFNPETSSVIATEGYVVHVLSDTAIVVEVPDAHFKDTMKDGTTVSLITSRVDTIL